MFQTEIDGLTQSEVCFTPEELERKWKYKGKEVLDSINAMEINKTMSEEEANEFIKLIKHNEYNVVEKLKKTPARTSLMSLILSFKPYRNAL